MNNIILSSNGWWDGELWITIEDISLKALEIKASELHTLVEQMNQVMIGLRYHLQTEITGEENKYKLIINVQEYNESEYEHKENSHRQEINI